MERKVIKMVQGVEKPYASHIALRMTKTGENVRLEVCLMNLKEDAHFSKWVAVVTYFC